ncbi:MAG: glycosyltransferase family 2 protein [Oscillospiraceae bacterium]|nr:glycosyltransferase family 2 protein [Oscillospiraceae bacterium]
MNPNNLLYLVVPCYNEQEVLPETHRRLSKKLEQLAQTGAIASNSKMLFVDDGSRDSTWQIIAGLAQADPHVAGVKLSRNRGHQNALLAGLTVAAKNSDITISVDADLQDDLDAIDQMVEKYHNGAQIVDGVRSDRTTDSFFKRTTAQGFYKLMEAMGVETVYNHADYRLMSRRALEELLSFKEVNLFLRGMVPQLGFKTDTVTYKRAQRFAGQSKYPLKKMLALAINGITSFSVKPLQLVFWLGLLCGFGGLCATLCQVVLAVLGKAPSTAAFVLSSLWLVCGILLTALGVVGEYVGKIYLETKARPRFVIEQVVGQPADDRN